MRSKVYHPSCDEYTTCLQRGGSPAYAGTVMQRGYGIGGIVKGLTSSLIPLLPKFGKAAATTAVGICSDKMSGIRLSKSIKKRSVDTGRSMIMNALSNKPTRKRRNKRPSARHVKRIRSTDAFGSI